MSIQVVRGLIGGAVSSTNSSAVKASTDQKSLSQQVSQAVRSGATASTDAAISNLRQASQSSEGSKIRDPKAAKVLAESVSEKILNDKPGAEGAHALRPGSGQSAL